MTREEFIKSDEYVIATVECIVRSHKSILKTRDELNKFFLDLRDELLLYAQQPNSEPQPQLQQTPCSTLRELLVQKMNSVTEERKELSYNSITDIEKAQEIETINWVLSLIDASRPVA